MTLENLLNQGKVKTHTTSKDEIQNLLKAIERDINDASIHDLSSERRFCIAYNAILLSATILLNCKGYRTSGESHHLTTIKTIPIILGIKYLKLSRYFDHCRYKRNLSDYERIGQVSNKETEEILQEAQDFLKVIKEWLKTNYPKYT